MAIGSVVSVFAKKKIHGVFQSLYSRKIGLLGIAAGSALGIASPLCMELSRLPRRFQKAVSDYLGNGKRIMYVNVMNRLSVDCDCDGHPAEPDMHDIGILASSDPVALDQACVDLIYEQKNGDGASLVNRIESRNGLLTLEHADEIGLGSRVYTLVDIDR